MTVSYTHLDVYKRQHLNSMDMQRDRLNSLQVRDIEKKIIFYKYESIRPTMIYLQVILLDEDFLRKYLRCAFCDAVNNLKYRLSDLETVNLIKI